MPTYTYQCKVCGHAFDVFHAMSATPRIRCEECEGKCERLIGTGAGLIFKGSGFYETDFKDKKGTPPAKAGPEKKPGKSAESTKADTKPASKPAAASKD